MARSFQEGSQGLFVMHQKKWQRERPVPNELFSPRSSVGLAFDRGMEDNHDVVYLRLYFFAVTLRISRISWAWKEKLISEAYTG
jgi:hypothetical protein